jgi:hypothetical protein
MAFRTSLVKLVLASQAIYHLMPLNVAPDTLKYINKVERAFLWAAKDSTTGAKCKVNWEAVCRPKKFGGLGVLHLEKFVLALRLRWPWLEWKEPDKIWVGSGKPCTKEDMNIFYAATKFTIGNGGRLGFGMLLGFMEGLPKILPPTFLNPGIERSGWFLKFFMGTLGSEK